MLPVGNCASKLPLVEQSDASPTYQIRHASHLLLLPAMIQGDTLAALVALAMTA